MSGTLTIRPFEAHLLHDKDLIGKMDPYCIVHLGKYNIKGQICKSGGKNPHWGDTFTVRRNHEKTVVIEFKDYDRFSRDDPIGVCHINLTSLPAKVPITQWYQVHRRQKVEGEILIELTFTPDQQQYGGQMNNMQAAYCPFKMSPYLSNHVQMTMSPSAGYQQPMYAPSDYQQQQSVYQQQQPMMQPMSQQQQPIMMMMQGGFQQQQPIYQQQPMMMQGGFRQQPMYQQQLYGQPGCMQQPRMF